MKKLNVDKAKKAVNKYVAVMFTILIVTLIIIDRTVVNAPIIAIISMLIALVGVAAGMRQCFHLANLPEYKKSKRG